MGNPITKSKNSDHHSQNGSSTSKNGSKLPEFLLNMASILERKIQTNEKMLRRSRTKERVTIYHGTRPPTLSIRQYLSRVFEYSNCSPSCFVVGYIYMEKFIQQSGCYVTTLNVHRILLACVLVAVKFLEDECFNNAYFAKIGGVSTAEINSLEIKLLLALNYRIYVSPDTFHHYCAMLASAAENEGPGPARTIMQLVWSEREPVKQRPSKTRR